MEIHHLDPNLLLYPPTRKYMPLKQQLRKTLCWRCCALCANCQTQQTKQNVRIQKNNTSVFFHFIHSVFFSKVLSSPHLSVLGAEAVWRSLNIPKLSSSDRVSPHEAPNKNSDSVYQQKSFLNNFTISLSYTTSTKLNSDVQIHFTFYILFILLNGAHIDILHIKMIIFDIMLCKSVQNTKCYWQDPTKNKIEFQFSLLQFCKTNFAVEKFDIKSP